MSTSSWTSTGQRRTPTLGLVLRYTILTATALVILIPLVWTLLSSFKTEVELAARPPRPLHSGRPARAHQPPRHRQRRHDLGSAF